MSIDSQLLIAAHSYARHLEAERDELRQLVTRQQAELNDANRRLRQLDRVLHGDADQAGAPKGRPQGEALGREHC